MSTGSVTVPTKPSIERTRIGKPGRATWRAIRAGFQRAGRWQRLFSARPGHAAVGAGGLQGATMTGAATRCRE
jgi:hypothetical protein